MLKPSRQTLVDWVNGSLKLDIDKVDDLGTGAAYCQLLDSLFGDIPMNKVKFDSKNQFDWETNWKIVQQAFVRHEIHRDFDVQRLMRCRLQDNLDFSQWLYDFWHKQSPISGYDPVTRRNSSYRLSGVPASRTAGTSRSVSGASSTSGGSLSRVPPPRPRSRVASATGLLDLKQENTRLHQENEELRTEVADLRVAVDTSVGERELYYSKLLEIEELVGVKLDEFYASNGDEAAVGSKDPTLALIRQVQDIMFAAPDGFQPPHRLEDEPF